MRNSRGRDADEWGTQGGGCAAGGRPSPTAVWEAEHLNPKRVSFPGLDICALSGCVCMGGGWGVRRD